MDNKVILSENGHLPEKEVDNLLQRIEAKNKLEGLKNFGKALDIAKEVVKAYGEVVNAKAAIAKIEAENERIDKEIEKLEKETEQTRENAQNQREKIQAYRDIVDLFIMEYIPRLLPELESDPALKAKIIKDFLNKIPNITISV